MKCKLSLLLFTILLLAIACTHNPFAQGKLLYENQCAGCHGQDGEGFRDLYPPLTNSTNFKADPYNTACIIVNGLEGPMVINDKTYDQRMFAISGLTDVQITNILNYIAYNWNAEIELPLKNEIVKERLLKCAEDPKVY